MAELHQAGLFSGVGPFANTVAKQVFVLQSYQGADFEEVLAGWRSNLANSLGRMSERRLPDSRDDDSALRAVGAARARMGIPISEMLLTAAIQQKVLVEMGSSLAAPSRYRDELVLELMTLVQAWSTWGMHALASGYREGQLVQHRRANERQQEFVRRLLTGALARSEIRQGSEEYGLDPSAQYVALRARPSSINDLNSITRVMSVYPGARQNNGLFSMVEGELFGFCRSTEALRPTFAVGVSPPARLEDLHHVFRLATRALDGALALGQTGVVSIADLGLRASVVSDQEVTKVMLERYVAPFRSQGEAGEAILATVEHYLANQGRPGQTAKELYVHTNTVRYRLSRFETLTGCSLRDARTVVEVWWALQGRRVARYQVKPSG